MYINNEKPYPGVMSGCGFLFQFYFMLNMYKGLFTFFCVSFIPIILSGQNTIGLLSKTPEASFPGYNLIFPHNQSTVFLIDNCGQLVHEWTDAPDLRPGNAAEIMPNGDLIVCKRPNSFISDPIWAGGGGATIEVRTWNNQLKSSFTLNNDRFRLHHDFAPLPNGNILMIAWAKKDSLESIAAGRNPAILPRGEVWSEAVLEWDPVQDSIVWEWHVWDHLIQDYDADRANFGIVADHPERIDINYDEHDGHPDWLHMNAIAYNPVLDQLVLSVPHFNEIWVVDHSTTTEEAAGSVGGRAGKGGDLLYRWGNPAAYGRGDLNDKKFFFQHDIHWPFPEALPGEPGFGQMAVFNNRTPGERSFGQLFQTPFDTSSWNYTLSDATSFGPQDVLVSRTHPDTIIRSYSASVSSVQLLDNGNWLLMSGRWGYAYELNEQNEIVWEYITPLERGMPAVQGDTLDIAANLTFRMKRYPEDFPAFAGRDLSPKGYIEANPNEGFCGLVVSARDTRLEGDWTVFPNPASEHILIKVPNHWVGQSWSLRSLMGQPLQSGTVSDINQMVPLNHIPKGMYVLAIGSQSKKIIIH